MKKAKMVMVMLVLVFSFWGCEKYKPDNGVVNSGRDYDNEVKAAIDVIKGTWINVYSHLDAEPYLEIKNTRIIIIKDNAVDQFKEF